MYLLVFSCESFAANEYCEGKKEAIDDNVNENVRVTSLGSFSQTFQLRSGRLEMRGGCAVTVRTVLGLRSLVKVE